MTTILLPEATERALRQLLRDQRQRLEQLSAHDVLDLATSFWTSTSIDGVRPVEGDGLVAYFELMKRRRTDFEFGVNRIMRYEEPPLWPSWQPAWRLRLSLGFEPTFDIFEITPVVSAVFDCWDKSQVRGFVEQVMQSLQFQVVSQHAQRSSVIRLDACTSPSGPPKSQVNGLMWAVT